MGVSAWGHSRLPVFDRAKHNIRGFILVKRFIGKGEAGETIQDLGIEVPVLVDKNILMLDLLNKFQEEKKHLALITNDLDSVQEAWTEGKEIPADVHMAGILTLEDIIEKMLQEDIDDEYDAKLSQGLVQRSISIETVRSDKLGNRRRSNLVQPSNVLQFGRIRT